MGSSEKIDIIGGREVQIEDWLGSDNQLGIDIWNKKYCHDGETFDEWLDRVSNGDQDLRRLIAEKKFLFGGRILANTSSARPRTPSSPSSKPQEGSPAHSATAEDAVSTSPSSPPGEPGSTTPPLRPPEPCPSPTSSPWSPDSSASTAGAAR